MSRSRGRTFLAALVLCTALVSGTPAADGSPRAVPLIRRGTTADLLAKVNAKRVARGRDPLREVAGISDIAQTNSDNMAAAGGDPFHTPNLDRKLRPWHHTISGENVGKGSTVSAIMYAWMHSDVHKANILKRAFTRCGVGLASDGTYLYATVIFID